MLAIVPPLDRNLSDAAKARAQSHSCGRRADLSGAVADKRMPRVASMRAGIGDSISIESAAGLKKAEYPSYHAAGGGPEQPQLEPPDRLVAGNRSAEVRRVRQVQPLVHRQTVHPTATDAILNAFRPRTFQSPLENS